MRVWLRVGLVALLLMGILGPAVRADWDDRFAILAFVVDGSRSIHPDEFEAVQYGLSNAIMQEMGQDPLRVGRVEVMIIQFGIEPGVLPEQVRVELSPIVVDENTRNYVRDTIRNMQQGFGDTPTAAGIRLATQLIVNSANYDRADRIIINVITDGQPYNPTKFPDETAEDAAQARQDALDAAAEAEAAGVDELDTEIVGTLGERPWQHDFFMQLAFPPEPVKYGEAGQPTPDVGQSFVYTIGSQYNFEPPIEQKLRAPFPTPTVTATPSNTPTNTPTNTLTPTETPVPTETYTPTVGPSPTPTDTDTPGPTLTPTDTYTPGPTATPTPEPPPEEVPEGDSATLLLLGLVVLLIYAGSKLARQGGGHRPA